MSFAGSCLREVSPTVDRRNNGVVSLKNKIVELSADDGAKKVKLFGGIGSGEDIHRPVPYRRAPQMRMAATDPAAAHQHARGYSRRTLPGPTQSPPRHGAPVRRPLHSALRAAPRLQ